jgi:protein phosphatase 1 regulatory subunit 7
MQENYITKIEGLDNLCNLGQINLCKNCIYKVEGLQGCTSLTTLLIGENRLGQDESMSNVESL